MESSWKCMKVSFHKQLAWSGSVWKPGVSYGNNLQIYVFSIPFWALALPGVVTCWKADGISSFVFLALSVTRKGCSTQNVNTPNQGCWCPEHHEEQQNPYSLKWSHTEHSAPTTTSIPDHLPWESIPPFLFPHTDAICSLDTENQSAAKNFLGHLKLGPRMEVSLFFVAFSWYEMGACIGNLAVKLWCETLYWAPASP